MLPTALAALVVPLINLFTHKTWQPVQEPCPTLLFELRHLHAVASNSSRIIFTDVFPDKLQAVQGYSNGSYPIRTRPITTHRPSSFAAFARARTRALRFGETEWLDWEEEEVLAPDVESREVLLHLAKMTNNAYVDPDDPAWYDLNEGWNTVRGSDIYLNMCSLTSLPVLPVWMGARRRRVSWTCFCDCG
jgi:lipase ATG15